MSSSQQNNSRPSPLQRSYTSLVVDEVIHQVSSKMKDKELALIFENCYPNTLDTTVRFSENNLNGKEDTFVVTGDINAMWLRDSSNQVLPYASLLKNDSSLQLRKLFRGLINRQVYSVLLDPYANAFNFDQAPSMWQGDTTYKLGFLNTQIPAMTFHLHERKYELDSLCAVLKVSYKYFQYTGDVEVFGQDWLRMVRLVLDVISEQQAGSQETLGKNPPYFFQRETTAPTDTLQWGSGPPARRTGMSKSPFRPSDDASTYPFPTAANAMAVVSLQGAAEILAQLGPNAEVQKLRDDCLRLAQEIRAAIEKYSVMDHPKYGKIYAYEVDGYGNGIFMDDANVPSLLSLPYLGFCEPHDPLYVRTRNFLLSSDNPYFFSGSAGSGIGGPHVGLGYIWPMSVMMQAFTSTNDQEIQECLQILKSASAGTGFMHESFWYDDANNFTRPWFAWANSLFGELILYIAETRPSIIF